jgi:RNA polymerase sigma factor (sigma-70 family)
MFSSANSGKVRCSEVAMVVVRDRDTHLRDEEGKTLATKSHSLVNNCSASVPHFGRLCDGELVAAAKDGHQGAFGELFARYSPRILRRTLRITRNREDAEDALQDSFLNALVHIGNFEGRSSFSTWLTRIAINSALMKLRKNRAYPEVSVEGPTGASEDFVPYESADPKPDPEELFSQRQREQIVAGAVRSLRAPLRQMVEIRKLQESSMRETAKMLRISTAAAKSRLHHARVALRRMPALRAIAPQRVRRAA